MDKVCIYLRKSRADEEMEKEVGKGATLYKHKKCLLEFAKENGLDVIKLHEEMVSGESLLHRPAMLQLLKEVEEGLYSAVLCMDIDRLGRGNMQDQGLIIDTFKKSNTRIITPRRTYDLNNEFDEEYTEFEAFMARKELKIINRRLQNGRIRSIKDGNYIGATPPYGYLIQESKTERILVPHPEQANVVKLIFKMYVDDCMGCGSIANQLNNLGYKSYTGKPWGRGSVSVILKNQVYIGKITWRKKEVCKSSTSEKKKDVSTRPISEWIVCKGKHDPIIDEATFLKAQKINTSRHHPPFKINNTIANPLSGLIVCGICGMKMKRRPYKNASPHLICENKCGNKSSRFDLIESAVNLSLKEWFLNFNIHLSQENHETQMASLFQHQLSILHKEHKELLLQKATVYELFEKKTYDIDTFRERLEVIESRISSIDLNIQNIKKNLKSNETQREKTGFLGLKNIMDIYSSIDDTAKKNVIIKELVERIVYTKSKDQKNDQFSLVIYPKIHYG